MPTPSVPDELLREALKLKEQYGFNTLAAAHATRLIGGGVGINDSVFGHRLRLAHKRFGATKPLAEARVPVFPDDDIPIEDVIKSMSARYQRMEHAKNAKRWFPIEIGSNAPIGLAMVGDPHLDDNGTNWTQLQSDIAVMRDTPGLFALNLGDTTNGSWPGKLMRLWANQDTSQKTQRRLAEWFLAKSGIRWLVWLLGNHDAWGEGSEILRRMNAEQIPMEDWQARFKLVFPNQRECKIWAAHDFKGNSQWNSLHGPQKAAHTKAEAHIYAAGHTHNWALHQEESASKEFIYWLARARGYKHIDEYAELIGHQSQKEGSSILAVINPTAKTESSFVQCFADLEHGADYLTFIRKKAGANGCD